VRLWALSDLHVGHAANRDLVAAIPPRPDDWLAIVGDVGETLEHLRFVLATLAPRFARVVWVPGNHELWTLPDVETLRGEAKYRALVALCRAHGVLTPEDPYEVLDDGARRHLVAPLFTLYDYSFAPGEMTPREALAWARASGIECVDEQVLHAAPHASKDAWCAERCAYSEARLEEALRHHDGPVILVDHFPLLPELAVLPRIPRFSVWCGTRRTRDWHRRFRAELVLYGHLHMPGSRVIDGVRFEEVSLGYPSEWRRRPGARLEPRLVVPAPAR
jgi:3',5'-cyclic AMP phosphodiesterase CpdA